MKNTGIKLLSFCVLVSVLLAPLSVLANRAPKVFDTPDQTAEEGSVISPITILVFDRDGDPLSVNVTGLPLGLSYTYSSVDSSVSISGTVGTDLGQTNYVVGISADDGQAVTSKNFVFTVLNNASAMPDPDATVVYLRESCKEAGVDIPSCFLTTGAVMGWINARNPGFGPVAVEIGPGRFGAINCIGKNDISFNGAGPEKTRITGVDGTNCFDIHFQDLSVEWTFPASVYWHEDGRTTWENVWINGELYGWTETCSDTTNVKPVHRWFSSVITGNGKTAYQASCSENWFFGSEIVASGNPFNSSKAALLIRRNNGQTLGEPEAHVYGSVIRVIANPGDSYTSPQTTAGSGFVAVYAGAGGQVHIHGTGIDVIGNDVANDIAALVVSNGGSIHASGSSYVMQTASGGKSIRLHNAGGVLRAPYLWEDILGTAPIGDLQTIDGSDMTVENVCSDASCQTAYPHMLIYSSACTTDGPWFDVVTAKCRGE